MTQFSNISAPSVDLFEAIGFNKDQSFFLSSSSFATSFGQSVLEDGSQLWCDIADHVSGSMGDNSRKGYLSILDGMEEDHYPVGQYKSVRSQITNWNDMAIVPSLDSILEALKNQLTNFSVCDVEILSALTNRFFNDPKHKENLPAFMFGDDIISNPFLSPTELFPAEPAYEYGIENAAKWLFEFAFMLNKPPILTTPI